VTATVEFRVEPGGPLHGAFRVPGDKSVSHRALLFGAIAAGRTRITGFLRSADTAATLAALESMGVDFDQPAPDEVIVHGVGLHGLRAPCGTLDLGNSGTSVRLLAGLLAGQGFDCELTGDASLRRRPMGRVVEPLTQMGAAISCSPDGTLPIRIRGGARLRGIEYPMPVASAQVKSAVLLAGLYAEGATCVTEPSHTRDHTERMLGAFGCPVERNGRHVCVRGQALTAQEVSVPGDISSAAFFMVAATVNAGSEIVLQDVGVNPTRSAVIDILGEMGADISVVARSERAGEPVADLRIRSAALRGIAIPPALVPIAIDEFPAILAAGAFAYGETTLTGAAELRYKESDRIAAMSDGLMALGVDVESREDGMVIRGGQPGGGTVDSRGDHRIAMAFAALATAAGGPVRILDCANVDTSFPAFAAALRALGGRISVCGPDAVG
jgi:3-phosphoshikimate 1-carboxyvinyltransferase